MTLLFFAVASSFDFVSRDGPSYFRIMLRTWMVKVPGKKNLWTLSYKLRLKLID